MCKSFGICGGCVHLDIPYEEELALKERGVRELLSPFFNGGVGFSPIVPAPSCKGYRNKMEFAFGDEGKDGGLALGIRNRRSMYEVSVPEECELVPGDFRKIVLCALEFFRGTGERFYHRKRHTGTLRHLVVRRGEFTGEILVNLVTTSKLGVGLDGFVNALLSLALDGEIVGLLHTVNDGVADTVKDENVRALYGRDYFHEKINGLEFKVTAFSFFQTNSAGAERLYEIVREYATRGGLAYDLYCGTGTIAQILADSFESVTGVELNENAVLAARENALGNKIANVKFVSADVLKFLDGGLERADVIVVDPPRDGLHPKALGKIIGLDMGKLVYVSCKPASLARDMATLTENGFKLGRAVCVDMFPRTAHVETVCVLTKI